MLGRIELRIETEPENASELTQKLEEQDWTENTAYLRGEERVWYSDEARLYIRDASDSPTDYDTELLYLEGRFNPETVATGETIEEITDRVL